MSQSQNLKRNESWTIRQALAWASRHLQAAGIPDTRLSAELLLGSVLSLDRLSMLLSFDQYLQELDWRSFEEKVFCRAKQEPIAYLIGRKEFWSLNFEVNPSVLIPRPETELLVEEALKFLPGFSERKILVELGTGAGAVVITLAKSIAHPNTARFLATDLSWPALQTSKKNASHHGVEGMISFVQGDWLKPFSNQRWIDLLVSNPPYVSETELLHLPQTVKMYEPLKALSGGPDGLMAIRFIFQQAGTQLKKGGWLILEIGETQGSQVLELAQHYGFLETVIRQDYSGKDRILTACYHG